MPQLTRTALVAYAPAELLAQYEEVRANSIVWVNGLKENELELKGRHPFLGETSIREVIPFPKTAKGTDLMSDAPSPANDRQLRELGIQLRRPAQS